MIFVGSVNEVLFGVESGEIRFDSITDFGGVRLCFCTGHDVVSRCSMAIFAERACAG